MPPRFYTPTLAASGDLVTLAEDEARHLDRVRRLGVGDVVLVFNGRGGQFEGVVETSSRHAVAVRARQAVPAAPEPRVAVTLAQGVLKGDKMDGVVRDAVMMGVGAIQPIVSAHSEASLGRLAGSHRRERWERIAIASAKQCGRAIVPPVLAPVSLGAVCDAITKDETSGGLMFVEPTAAGGGVPLGRLAAEPPQKPVVILGPEGGWSADDLGLASPCCQFVLLGGRTLRADAMALVALAALFARWNEY